VDLNFRRSLSPVWPLDPPERTGSRSSGILCPAASDREIYILNPVVLFMHEGGTSAGSGSIPFDSDSLYRRFRRKNVRLRPAGSVLAYEERIHWTRERRLRDAESLEMFDSCRCCEIVPPGLLLSTQNRDSELSVLAVHSRCSSHVSAMPRLLSDHVRVYDTRNSSEN